MATATTFPETIDAQRAEVRRRDADAGSPMPGHAGWGSPSRYFGEALRHALITVTEYESAADAHGSRWNYAGD